MPFEIKSKTKQAVDDAAKKTTKPKGGDAPKGFLKTGAAAKALMDKADAEYAARQNASNKAWRFWLPAGEDAYITFLTGQISPETGILDIPYANEHREKVGGKWEDFVCTEDHEPCPLCAAGSKKSFVGYLSILDHREREYEDKDGKTVKVKVTPRLLVAKSESLKQLIKMAEKRGEDGLVGSTYEASRTGKKKAAIGDMFDYDSTHSLEELIEEFGEDAEPLDMDEQVPYYTAAQLIEMGLGEKTTSIGGIGGGSHDDDEDDDEGMDADKAKKSKPW